MVVEHRRSSRAVTTLYLRQVLPDGYQLDPVEAQVAASPSSSGNRRDVRRLVEHHQQRWVQWSSGPGRSLERRPEHLLGQRTEVATKSPLVVGGRAQVEGVRTAVEQSARFEHVSQPRLAHLRKRRQDRLRRRRHRASCPLVAAPGRLRRGECLAGPVPLENVGDLRHLLGVDPPHDIGHGAATPGCGQEQRGKELGRRGVPKLSIGRRPVGLRRLAEIGSHSAGPAPIGAARKRGPGAGRQAGTRRGIDTPHPPRAARGRDESRVGGHF